MTNGFESEWEKMKKKYNCKETKLNLLGKNSTISLKRAYFEMSQQNFVNIYLANLI